MLIIFDLDDTLVDTSGCIMPVRLRQAVCRMQAAGLSGVYEDLVQELDRWNAQSLTAEEALDKFLISHSVPAAVKAEGMAAFYDVDELEMPIHPLPGAPALLQDLSQCHQLALVTVGKPLVQLAKLKKASIDSSVFSKIVVSEERNKKEHYRTLQQEGGWAASHVLVCGDRISIDLTPAQELGFKTLHVRWGRGRYLQGPVDYAVDGLDEVRQILIGKEHDNYYQ